MAKALLSIPTEERILLYLSDFPNLESVYEAPPDITQKEIALSVRVQRKHISRYLKKLASEGMVEEKTCHVQGAKQRMKCYYLSWRGMTRAKEIRKYVGNRRVRVRIDGKEKEMLVSEIDGATSVHLTLSDIVGEAQDSKDHLDMTHLEQIEERKRRLLDERTHKAEVYRNALAVAWRSGVLTPSEKQLIESLKTHLGITDEEHKSMEEQVINNIEPIRKEHRELLEDMLYLVEKNPTEREAQLIQMLRERFNLD
jgi:hypothetical protein